MNFFQAAERIAAIDRSQVMLDPQRCLHAQDRFSTCAACFSCCPVEAILPGQPPQLQVEACVNCLACLPICPVGAYSADDAVPALLNCTARLDATQIELVCEVHPEPTLGLPETQAAVQVRGCLAGLGAAVYLSLMVLGVERVILRAEACAECPVGSLRNLVEQRAGEAQALLETWGYAGALALIQDLEETSLAERPCWPASDPPLSRRDLFRLASRQGQIAAARAMQTEYSDHSRTPGRERRRLLAVLPRLPQVQADGAACSADPGAAVTNGFGWASLKAGCTACGACVRACPTRALSLEDNELDSRETFALYHDPRLCIGCETCMHVCAPDVIMIDPAPPLAQVFGRQEPLLLLEGEYRRCKRCKARFYAVEDQKLCPVCDFRRQNPFGTALPPALLGLKEHPRSQPATGKEI